MNFCELFVSIQGEGFFSGTPSIFARVSGCNLKCCFAGGSICDTAYTSFSPEISSYTEEDLIKMIEENPNVQHLVFTGGEPLMYAAELDELVGRLYDNFAYLTITIETNGTFDPLEHTIDLYSVSPKLSTSVPNKPCKININGEETFTFTQKMIDSLNKKRIDIDRLVKYHNNSQLTQFKFVYSGPESITEIEDIVKKLSDHVPGIDTMVILMPEGQLEKQLEEKREKVVQECIKHGWTYSDRLQILIWGQKRNV